MTVNVKVVANFVILALISTIVCDNNVSTTESTTILSTTTPIPTTIQSTLSTTGTTILSQTTPLPIENSTKIVQSPSNRTQFLNTTSYLCNCDLTVNLF